MTATDIKVLVVDDEGPARERLCALLAELPGHETVGEAATGEEALERAAKAKPGTIGAKKRNKGRSRK